MTAGSIYVPNSKTEISDMIGLEVVMPFTFFAFFIGFYQLLYSIISGAWSKRYLMEGAFDANSCHYHCIAYKFSERLLFISYSWARFF